MIGTKMISKLVIKRQSLASKRRKRFALSSTNSNGNLHSSSSVANKGHFVVYTTDWGRFEMPLEFLNNDIFQELCRMSEEEFGLPTEGPIRMQYNSVLMKYIISVIREGLIKDMQKALLSSMVRGCCSSSASFHQQHTRQQLTCCQ